MTQQVTIKDRESGKIIVRGTIYRETETGIVVSYPTWDQHYRGQQSFRKSTVQIIRGR